MQSPFLPSFKCMKVAILTLGCRVNQSESFVIEATLKGNGVSVVDLKDKPDYCIVNTCTVTTKSDYNSRQLIRRAARTGAKVIVTGCYSQLKPDVIKKLPGVEKIFDIKSKYDIISLLTESNPELDFGSSSHSRPYLKVQDGCNYHCSYCSVPLARGRSKSITIDEVIRRAHQVIERGFHEIVLTGIHLGTYGQDLNNPLTLTSLIKTLLDETQIHRIRLSSIDVNEIDDELIELMQDRRLCSHLHLPLQSGSNKILGAMRRRYSAEGFEQSVLKISRTRDNISIGTDIIVGFPGEGRNEFDESFDLVTRLPISYMHIFPFSPRPGTAAFHLKNIPASATIKQRFALMKELDSRKRKNYLKQQIGRDLEVILEENVSDFTMRGTSSNYLKILVSPVSKDKGSVVYVRPAGILEDGLTGNLIL